MITFTCPHCGEVRTGKRRRCYPCTLAKHTPESRERIRRKLKGRKHTDERRRNIAEGKKRQIAADGRVFDLAAYMQDKPHPFAKPPGTERIVKDGRVQVRCADGKWRYRSRLVWEEANGPIPPGQVIHHRNHDPLDDRLENLQMLTRAEHMDAHRNGA